MEITSSKEKKPSCCERHPVCFAALRRYVVQPLILLFVIALVFLPSAYFYRKHQNELKESLNRVQCLHDANEADCRSVGCLWSPLEIDVPSCFYPPVYIHGYEVVQEIDTQAGYDVRLNLLTGSATPFNGTKPSLLLQIMEYGEDMFRLKVTVPDEERYEVPVQLQAPPVRRSSSPRYNISYALRQEEDTEQQVFSLTVSRVDTGTVIFDTSIGGFTYASQFLQIVTRLPEDSAMYGIGENIHPSFRHRYDRKVWPLFARDQPPRLGQENLYGAHPVYYLLEADNNAHAVFWLNSNAMEYELMPTPALVMRSIGGIMDLFFMMGPTPNEAVQQYVSLIGRPVMPAYWALGFQLCRYGYDNLEELKEAVTRTHRHGIPQDVQYGDIDMMDRQLDFTVDPINFPGLPEYIKQVKPLGLRFIVILDPAINAELPAAEYEVHQRATDADVYIKWSPEFVPENNYNNGDVMLGYVWPENRVAFPDFLKSSTANWWKNEIRIFYNDIDVKFDGLWIDMNEPANFDTNLDRPWNYPPELEDWNLHCNYTSLDDPPYLTEAIPPGRRLSDKTLCMSALQGETSQLRHYDVHNLYGWAQSPSTLEAVHEVTGRRGLVISRSTYPSSGRWAGHWLGDNSALWTHMRDSITGTLEFNLFGIPYVGADICGFFLDSTEELCARWMQLGAFYPFSRNHNGIDFIPHDPGRWPTVGRVSRAVMRVRYTLLPYLYTLHYEAHITGRPVVRSLAFEFPDQKSLRDIDTQFLWGKSLLIAPVLHEGEDSVTVRFPSAGRWYSYYTGRMATNVARELSVPAPLSADTVPLFVNGGAIIPTQRPAMNTMRSRLLPLGLIVAPTFSDTASGYLYWDDGETIDPISDGTYLLANITYENSVINWMVTHPDAGSAAASAVLSDVRVFAVSNKPHLIMVDGKRVTEGDWHYDGVNEVLELFDLAVPIDSNFSISWASEAHFPLPCPFSFASWNEATEVTQEMCELQNCVWSIANKVQCQLPGPEEHGYAIAGVREDTVTGFRVPLKKMNGSMDVTGSGGLERLMFEVYYYSEEILRVKLFDPAAVRYEVPLPLRSMEPSDEYSAIYEVTLESEEVDAPFSFIVTRRDTKTVIFDTRLGGLTFEDQFVSLTTLLASKNFYGLGENNHPTFKRNFDGKIWSIFSRSQQTATDMERNMNGAHPFYEVIENDGNSHGVLLWNSNAIDYQLLDYPSLTLRTIGGVLDLFVFLGPSPEGVVAQYTHLVGRPTLPPYWALGFHLSKDDYTLEEIEDVVSRNRNLDIPQDVQHVGSDYMDDKKVFTLSDSFADLPSYVQELHTLGLKLMVELTPAIAAELPEGQYPPYYNALANGRPYVEWPGDGNDTHVAGNGTTMLGYAGPSGRVAYPSWVEKSTTNMWWQNEINNYYHLTLNFDGVCLEGNEPAVDGTQSRPEPLLCPDSKWDDPPYLPKAGSVGPSMKLSDGTLCMTAADASYRHYDVHNLYGIYQTEATATAMQTLSLSPERRGLVLSSSSYSGSGQHGGRWLSHTNSDWPDMRRSIVGVLDFNLFGVPLVGASVCGEVGDATEELCARWMQLGAFYPFSRNHNGPGQQDQDPAHWPDTVAQYSKAALEVRYRLLPYLYTLFYDAAVDGHTVVRPLIHEFPSDRNVLSIDDQFLWGAGLMVSPVLSATGQRSVYFPIAAWYDYYQGTPHLWPGERVTVTAPSDVIPLHIRGGTIIPTQQPALNTHTSRHNPMGLIVALDLDRKASGHLFWDDLEGVNTIGLNRFSRVLFSFSEETLNLTVLVNHNEDLGALKYTDLEFLGIELVPDEVVVSSDSLGVVEVIHSYDPTNLKLSVTLNPGLDVNTDHQIQLRGIWNWPPT